jgi:ABC-type methionine transport system permease subunit
MFIFNMYIAKIVTFPFWVIMMWLSPFEFDIVRARIGAIGRLIELFDELILRLFERTFRVSLSLFNKPVGEFSG